MTLRSRVSVLAGVAALAFANGCSHSDIPPLAGSLTAYFSVTQAPQGASVGFTIGIPQGPITGDELVVAFSGLVSGTDSLTIPSNDVNVTGRLLLPAGMPDGTITMIATMRAIDQSSTAILAVKDIEPPRIDSVSITSSAPLPPFSEVPSAVPPFVGGMAMVAQVPETLRAVVTDNHSLAWLGWSIGSPSNGRDSMALTGIDDTVSLPILLPSSAPGTPSLLSIFLRDAEGNVLTRDLGITQVGAYRNHPVRSAALDTAATDFAFDTKRGLVYIAQPDISQVAVLSLATMMYQAPLTLPSPSESIDVTVGGDSLYATLAGKPSIAVVNLANASHPVTTIGIQPVRDTLGDTTSLAFHLRLSADGFAFVTLISSNRLFSSVVQINLANDSQAVAQPLSPLSGVVPQVWRSPDATVIIADGRPGATYRVGSPCCGVTLGLGALTLTSFSNAREGVLGPDNVYFGRHILFDTYGFHYGPVGVDTLYGEAVAPNEIDAFVADSRCASSDTACLRSSPGVILHYKLAVDLTTGHATFALLDVGDIPQLAGQVAVSPDGNTLLARGSTTLMALDLTQSSPPSSAYRRPLPIHGISKLVTPTQAKTTDDTWATVQLDVGQAHKTIASSTTRLRPTAQ